MPGEQQPNPTPTVPTVPSDRAPVVLPEGAQPAAAVQPGAAPGTEEARMARVLATLQRGASTPAPAQPAATPAPAATQQPAQPPPEAPASPVVPPELAQALQRLEGIERALALVQQPTQPQQPAPDLAKWQTFEQKLREEDALAALETLGVTFDDLSRAVVNGRGVEGQTDRVAKQVEALEKRINDMQKAREDAEQQALVVQAHREIEAGITARSPLLAQYGELARDMVLDHIRTAFDKSGGRSHPTIEQAITAVEGEIRGLVRKALSVTELRAELIGDPPPSSEARDPAAPVNPGRPQTTITNEHASAAPPRRVSTEETEDERVARALARIRR